MGCGVPASGHCCKCALWDLLRLAPGAQSIATIDHCRVRDCLSCAAALYTAGQGPSATGARCTSSGYGQRQSGAVHAMAGRQPHQHHAGRSTHCGRDRYVRLRAEGALCAVQRASSTPRPRTGFQRGASILHDGDLAAVMDSRGTAHVPFATLYLDGQQCTLWPGSSASKHV